MAYPKVFFSWNGTTRVAAFTIAQDEGGVATLEVTIENPGIGMLAPGRNKRCTLSVSETGDPADAVVLFDGTVNGTPTDLGKLAVTVEFLGQADQAAEKLRAFANTLRVLPHYDPLFFGGDHKDEERDPAEVLEARSEVFLVDPVSNDISLSDVLAGGAGTIDIGTEFDRDSFVPSVTGATVSKAKLSISTEWEQAARGEVDIAALVTPAPIPTFTDPSSIGDIGAFGAGTGWNVVSSETVESVPEPRGPLFRTGVKETVRFIVNGDPPTSYTKVRYAQNRFLGSDYQLASMRLSYDYAQARRETVAVRMAANVQPVLGDGAKEEDLGELTLGRVEEDSTTPLWEPGKSYQYGDVVQHWGRSWECRLPHVSPIYFSTFPHDRKYLFVHHPRAGAPGKVSVLVQWVAVKDESPISDLYRYSFFDTDRGAQAIQHGALRVEAFLRRRMRCFEVTFRAKWERLRHVTLDHNVRIEHPFFPEGEATGKVISYRKVWDGETQTRYVEVTLGVSAGTGAAPAPGAAALSYSEAFQPGYAVIRGPEEGRSYEAGRFTVTVTGDPIKKPVIVERLRQPGYAVQSVRWDNQLSTQISAGKKAEAQGLNPARAIGAVPTTVAVRLRSIAAADVLARRLEAACSNATGPKGVDLGG